MFVFCTHPYVAPTIYMLASAMKDHIVHIAASTRIMHRNTFGTHAQQVLNVLSTKKMRECMSVSSFVFLCSTSDWPTAEIWIHERSQSRKFAKSFVGG